jgi:hypothetical protein
MGAKYCESQKRATDAWVEKNRQAYNDYKRPKNVINYIKHKEAYRKRNLGNYHYKREIARLSAIFCAFE